MKHLIANAIIPVLIYDGGSLLCVRIFFLAMGFITAPYMNFNLILNILTDTNF